MAARPDSSGDEGSGGRARYVKVAVNSGRSTSLTFSYAVERDREIAPGEVVHVPWGQRTLQGIVVEGPSPFSGYNPDEVRPLEPPVEGAPVIPPERMELAAWVQHTYLAPAWESYALLLPPGAGERPRISIVRGPAALEDQERALSERQATILDALSDEPLEVGELRSKLAEGMPARGFDTALRGLVRRGLAERRYFLDRPRGRARVAEVARLTVEADEARRFAETVEGRRSSRRARAIRALVAAGGPLPFADVAREARGAPAVETLIEEGALVREGEEVRLILDEAQTALRLRQLSLGQADQAAVALLGRLAELAEAEEPPLLPLRGLAAELGRGAREGAKRLVAAGLVTVEEVLDRRDPLSGLDVVHRPPVELVAEQREVAAEVRRALDERVGAAILLRGVTGSGKTEVYLDALRHTVEQGRRGIVLVPEIALTPQTVRRFAERFPGRVGVLHSGLSLGEAFDEWHAIEAGEYDVVIGSRSAIFAPQPALGLIVIDEAHEWTYKQQDPAPRYDARAVARELASRSGATLLLGTATPSVEDWYEADQGDLQRLDLPRRIRPVRQPGGGTQLWPSDELPEVDVVDMRGARRLFSGMLVEALGEVLDRDEQAILFLNRRGIAGYLLCPQGHTPTCSSCDVALSLHEPKRLLCHQCGRSRPLPPACTECGAPLSELRAGTQAVEREVRKHYPTARVQRWDRDTARTADQHEAILAALQRHEVDVLVGTQMVAKGLDLPLVTLVGIVLADYSLIEGDFRARERALQLMVQVAGRAGRADRHGRVIVQTMQPDNPAVLAAVSNELEAFYEDELQWRADRGYPPFRRLVRLVFSHTSGAFAAEEAHRLADELRDRALEHAAVEVIGPTPPRVARVRGRHRWSILLRGRDPVETLRDAELPGGWVIDVDPVAVD